jgi:hypothetical protein
MIRSHTKKRELSKLAFFFCMYYLSVTLSQIAFAPSLVTKHFNKLRY